MSTIKISLKSFVGLKEPDRNWQPLPKKIIHYDYLWEMELVCPPILRASSYPSNPFQGGRGDGEGTRFPILSKTK